MSGIPLLYLKRVCIQTIIINIRGIPEHDQEPPKANIFYENHATNALIVVLDSYTYLRLNSCPLYL